MNYSISASKLKSKVADVLNDVHYKKNIAIIERYGKPIAKIIPMDMSHKNISHVKKALNDYFGVLPDFPEVTKKRASRKKSISL